MDASNCIKDSKTATCECELSGSGNPAPGQSCPVTSNGNLGCGSPTFRKCGFELDGYGVGLWNTDPNDSAPPKNPIGSCWSQDFPRDQQPLGTWDKYICVPGSKQLVAEGSAPPQSPAGGGPPSIARRNAQLYNRQVVGGGSPFSQSLATGSNSGLDSLISNCASNGGGGGGVGTAYLPQNVGGVVGGGSVLPNGLANSLAVSGGGSSAFTAGQCPGSVGPPS